MPTLQEVEQPTDKERVQAFCKRYHMCQGCPLPKCRAPDDPKQYDAWAEKVQARILAHLENEEGPKTRVTTVNSIFDDAFGDLEEQKAGLKAKGAWKGVHYRCLVAKDISPRHPSFEYTEQLGRGFIEPILLKRECHMGDHLTFYFPERWMSPWEQQRFPWCLENHPSFGTVKMVDIITGCPLIVGSFHREQVRILQNDELRQEQLDIWGK